MNLFFQLAQSTVEYQNWGVNSLTISFLLSLGLTVFTGWGIYKQIRTLWREKTGKAVSVIWISYWTALQLAILTYGFSIDSGALLFNGLLFALYLVVLVGLWRFKGYRTVDWTILFLLVGALIAMVVLPYKELFFFAFAFGGLVSGVLQPVEMLRKRSRQGLDIRLVATIVIGTVVWFVYGLAVVDWILITINAISFFIYSYTMYLWWRYRSATARGPGGTA